MPKATLNRLAKLPEASVPSVVSSTVSAVGLVPVAIDGPSSSKKIFEPTSSVSPETSVSVKPPRSKETLLPDPDAGWSFRISTRL